MFRRQPLYLYLKKTERKRKEDASAANRTRNLEGSYARHYTTDATDDFSRVNICFFLLSCSVNRIVNE